jgi:hypothetical protein
MAEKRSNRDIGVKIPWQRARLAIIGLGIVFALLVLSLQLGGHAPGLTYIDPGNVGLVVDNYRGKVEPSLMASGTHIQGITETVYEIPTQLQTIILDQDNAVQVNTSSNMLPVDVSVQYQYNPDKIDDLYQTYQDQFENQENFQNIYIKPDIKSAINVAIGDMDTATALTTAGKLQAQATALTQLNNKWAAQGLQFSTVSIRGIEQDQATKDILNGLLQKQQEIDNAQLGLQQQIIDNETAISTAQADARINHLQAASLTDLYVDDALLSQTHLVYMDSNQIMGTLKAK